VPLDTSMQFDKALCEGLNLLVWHAFVCSPKETGIPGQQYFAGTHLNPKVTWWEKSAPFFAYINRCQSMLQQGLPVADAAYYYGDHVPNFAQLRRSDPAKLGSGYDYDVITEEALLTRAMVKGGRIVLPDGMSYRVLVLPDRTSISLPVLRKLKELVQAGATVIGPKPEEASGLKDFSSMTEPLKGLGMVPYVGDHDRKDPVLSPICSDLRGFPPTLCMTSTRDHCLSGTVDFHRALLRAGVDVRLMVFDAMPHAFWYRFDLPESKEALEAQASFLDQHAVFAFDQ
jgi:hypothetical protein